MNPVRVEILISLVGAVLYIIIWLAYRARCRVTHNKLVELHRVELIHRAEMEIEYGYSNLSREELIRRAHWDADHGPLMQPLDIRRREESHWPIGNAFQGLSAIIAGIILASIFADGRPIVDQPIVDQSNVEPHVRASSEILSQLVAFEIFTSVMLLFSGATLFMISKSKYARALGVGLVLSSSILPAAKLINVERVVNIEKLISGNINLKFGQSGERVPANEEPKFSAYLTLPPFDSGSATPNAAITCAVRHLASFDLGNQDMMSFVIAGRADRTNLKEKTRRTYATNWGLAQQRASVIEQMLLSAGVHKSRIVTTNAGPIYTDQPTSDLLAMDRAATILINGAGKPPQWLHKLSNVGWPECQ